MSGDSLGWLFASIIVPVAAPNLALWLWSFVPHEGNTHWLMPVKDGQLCWAAIAFCAAGLYELRGASGHRELSGLLEVALVIIIFASGIMAAGGSVFPAPAPQPGKQIEWRRYRLFIGSAIWTLLGAVGYSVVHFLN